MTPPSSPPMDQTRSAPKLRHLLGGMTPERVRVWADRSLLAFLGLGFLAPSEPAWALWFYVLVLPFSAWAVIRGWRPDWKDGRLMLLLGLIAWSTLSIVWASEPRPAIAKQLLWAFNGLCTATYFLAVTALSQQSARMRHRMTVVIVCCAAGNALFSIARFLTRTGGWDRLTGWGETRHAILGAFIIGLCTMLALGRSLERGRSRAAWAAAVPVFLAFIVMTDSRGPLVTVVLSALIILPRWPRRAYVLAGAAILAVLLGVALLAPDLPSALYGRLAQRGTSYRLEIWQATIAQVLQRPVLGHGITATLAINGDFGHHPHDLYLSALFYTGAVGLALLIAGLGRVIHAVLRAPASLEQRVCLALLVHLLVSGATDLSQIIKGPGELWYIVWFPLAYAIGYLRDAASGDGGTAALQDRVAMRPGAASLAGSPAGDRRAGS